jgi:hypothetical protein
MEFARVFKGAWQGLEWVLPRLRLLNFVGIISSAY